jgi:hypothetical protein
MPKSGVAMSAPTLLAVERMLQMAAYSSAPKVNRVRMASAS